MLNCNLVFGLDGMFKLQYTTTKEELILGQNTLDVLAMMGSKIGSKMLGSYVWTARSVSNVSVLPLLTWNTYNFMLNLPEFSALAYLAHLVIEVHPTKKEEETYTCYSQHLN